MKRSKSIAWMGRIIAILLVASFLVAVLAVLRMQLVPLQYILLVVPVSALLVGLLVFLQLRRKPLSRANSILAIVISLLLITANVYITLVSNATSSFLGSLRGDDYTTIEYSVVAKKDRHIKLSSPQNVALLGGDTNTEAVKTEVNKKTKPTYQSYADVASVVLALSDQKSDTAAVKSSYLDLMKENYPDFYPQLSVLTTFTIKVKKGYAESKVDLSKPFVVYISGIDTYGAIDSVSRSDVNILAVVNPKLHKILLVNTPRDYYVQLHGTTGTRDKLTHAGIYGVDMSVTTLEDLYGTDISYHLRINFASLTKLIDTLGGVKVYSPQAFTAGEYSFQQGYNEVDGKQALAFSRERYSFENGDRTRGENQQRVIEAIINKLSSPGTIGNYQHILSSMEGAFQTNASENEIATLVREQVNSLKRWSVSSVSVDGTGASAPTYSMGDLPLYVMEPNQESVAAAKQKIQQYLAD